jgi:hypothetical protein
MSNLTVPSAQRALEPLEAILNADGYGFELAGEPLEILVVAQEGACEDCIVPPKVMGLMIAERFREESLDGEWQLRYPEAHSHA